MRGSDQADRLSFIAGSGEMARKIRAYDWANSPLGPSADWPQSLKTVVRIMLTSRYAMWMAWGPNLTFFCNDAYLPTVGIKRDWVLGSRSDKVWEEIWPDIGPRIDHVLKTGEATWDDGLLLFLERSGFAEETYHTFSYSPLADDDGHIAGMLCVVTEVTERTVGERRLSLLTTLGTQLAAARSEAEVAAAIETGLLAATKDLPFSLLYLKGGQGELVLTRAIGVPIGHPAAPPILLPNSPWTMRADVIELGFEFGELPRGPWNYAPKLAALVPIGSQGQKEPLGLLVAALNPHRPYNDDYANFIELAGGQIAAAIAGARAYEEERRRVQALAEIDRAKTMFFSNVSHEFRTPLTLMLGPLEDALATTNAPEQRALLEVAHRNALRLLRLVNSLLDFSRIEAGRVEAVFFPSDLSALTADLASSFRSAMEKAGLSLLVETAPLSSLVYVDRDMWEKIVLNLLSNAFKFTHEGEIAVSLRESDSKAILTVRDTGEGIPAAEIPRLFERFHRVEGAKGRSFEGSGIGLALVNELVNLHGGTIGVESEEGRGSIFTVKIPLGTAHLPAERVQSAPAGRAPIVRAPEFVEEALRWLPGQSGFQTLLDENLQRNFNSNTEPGGKTVSRGRVLLVDDNADLRDYIARLLTECGYELDTSADGEAALAVLRRKRPDIVVTDIMMPRLDGFGLLRAVRDDEGLRDLPVIMLSARAGEEAKVEGLRAGADDYLTKPFSARELIARVSANIELARVRREAFEAVRSSEERLRELNATLEQRVADALAEKRVLADIVQATDASVQVIDNEFRWLAINAAAKRDYERLFGVQPAVGDSLLEALADFPNEREAARRVWGRVLNGEPFTEFPGGETRRASVAPMKPSFVLCLMLKESRSRRTCSAPM
jgi:signal transduction histidine kinase/DNA-binding response OmpR family regulator